MRNTQSGFTLIELMIAVAIIAIISAIAIPAYNGYVTESYIATARSNAGPLKIALENERLDNGTYAGANGLEWDPSGTQDLSNIGWSPDGDNNKYIYNVTSATASGYIFTVTYVDRSDVVITCSKSGNACTAPTL